jgi:hypothetical protein
MYPRSINLRRTGITDPSRKKNNRRLGENSTNLVTLAKIYLTCSVNHGGRRNSIMVLLKTIFRISFLFFWHAFFHNENFLDFFQK